MFYYFVEEFEIFVVVVGEFWIVVGNDVVG